jgi:hypothetical protein
MDAPDLDAVRTPHDLHALVVLVDQACMHAESGGLVRVVHLLGLCVSPPEQLELLEVERLAELDIGKASCLWMSLRPRLRRRLFEQDADSDTGKHAQRT